MSERVVAIISSIEMACLFWNQRASKAPDEPVWWDYHVVLLVRQGGWQVYDLDSRLPCPADFQSWLRQTFRFQDRMPGRIRPRFLLFDGDVYVREFSSDRSHMRDAKGHWHSPPPDWTSIDRGAGSFHQFIEGRLRTASCDQDELAARFA